jgi:hypothetical protein
MKFRTDVILSIVSEVFVARNFSMVLKCIEHMAGGPVLDHQLPSWFLANQEKVREAFPDLADFDVSGIDRDTFPAWAAEHEHIMAEERDVPIFGSQPISLSEGLDPDKMMLIVYDTVVDGLAAQHSD